MMRDEDIRSRAHLLAVEFMDRIRAAPRDEPEPPEIEVTKRRQRNGRRHTVVNRKDLQ